MLSKAIKGMLVFWYAYFIGAVISTFISCPCPCNFEHNGEGVGFCLGAADSHQGCATVLVCLW